MGLECEYHDTGTLRIRWMLSQERWDRKKTAIVHDGVCIEGDVCTNRRNRKKRVCVQTGENNLKKVRFGSRDALHE